MNATNISEEIGTTDPPEGVTPISISEAQTMLKKYLVSAPVPVTAVKGVYLDRNQLNAMNRLVQENPAVKGFRVYFGKDANNQLTGIVLGTDDNQHDLTTNSIYKTDSAGTGPCPPICDTASPIVKDPTG